MKELILKQIKRSGKFGNQQMYILIIFVFLSLNYFKEAKFLIIGLTFLYIIAIPIRLLFFTPRPKPKKYTNLFQKIDASTIPSMHSGRSFFLGLSLITFFEYKIEFILLISTLLLSILSSRILLKQHRIIDLILGGILGISIFFILKIFL